jgi:hypothetical protein
MDCRLTDLGYSVYPFTWDNKREGRANVQARLDRATANVSFLEMFPLTQVQHIATEESDHMALLIKIAAEPDSRPQQRSRGFMFEEMWTKHPDYDRMLSEAWENSNHLGSGTTGLCLRLKEVSADLKKWSYNTFGSVQKEIKKLRAALEDAKT